MNHLALDIGNVLCHVDFSRFLDRLSKTLNITRNDVMHFLSRVQKLHDLGLTNLSDELVDHFNIKSEVVVEEIIEEWNRCIVPDQDVLKEINYLKKKYNLEIALLSNIGFEHAEYLRKKVSKSCPVFEEAIQFFSCDVGARKPTFLYYQSFLKMYPQFENCVYIDDLEDNINSAKKFGIQAKKFVLSEYKSNNLDKLIVGGSRISTYFGNIENLFTT